MRVVDLTVEYRRNPIGLDEIPRFSWKLEGEERNILQQSYRIRVRDGETMMWDSGWIESGQSLFVTYQGDALSPFTLYLVEVCVRDNHGETGQVQGFFETGLLSQKNWQAKWITHSLPDEEEACPVFMYRFPARRERIRRARAYVTCCGVYELKIDGEKAGDAFLAPGWTSYFNRIQYQTYDITGLLIPDRQEHTAEITVGNGWYKGFLNGEGQSCFYGDRTGILAMIRILYEDGSVQVFGTDTNWKTAAGMIRFSELYHGETQDFSYEGQSGFHENKEYCREESEYNAAGQAVLYEQAGRIGKIVAQQSEPVRIVKRLPAREKIITPRGELVIDFGQNLAGFVEVRLPELTGDSLIISHAETLDREGNFYTENLRTARSRDQYIYSRYQAERTVHPHFTCHGFRYIRVEGVDREVDIGRFTACVLHTDMEQTGSFSCDYEPVNRLMKNIEWTQRSNSVDIPTDCPQRDERLGWIGDAQIFSRTAMYQFHTALFYRKWLRDLAAESDPVHGIPQMAPNIAGPSVGTSVWGDAAVIIPWNLYLTYGDKEILREQYPNMKLWVDYITDACGGNTLWLDGFQRGDWLGLDGDASLSSLSGGTDKNLVANAYYAYSCRILRDAAGVLGREEDAAAYGTLYDRITEELNREYVTPNGRFVSETQTACVLLLHFGLLREEYRAGAARILKDNLNRHHGHLTTGFVGTAYLCHALTDHGMHELAGELLLAEDYPGWLYAVKKGATTVWERWNSILPDGSMDRSGMNSLNHCAFGAVGDWLYAVAAGISPLESGYKKIRIRPFLTKGFSEVTASYRSMYGEIRSHISCRDGRICVDVSIPANTAAVLELPERGEMIEIGSGTWHYEYPTETSLKKEAFSMNSSFAEILASPEGERIAMNHLPQLSDKTVSAFLRGKSLNEILAAAPQIKGQLEAMLAELNRRT